MIKISKLTDYAVVILSVLAREDVGLMSASAISGQTGLPEPTVAKVLKLLSKGGVVTSVRGVNGGYTLQKLPADISIAAVIDILDGPVHLTACVDGSAECCAHEKGCPIKGSWNPVNAAMAQALQSVTLAQMLKV